MFVDAQTLVYPDSTVLAVGTAVSTNAVDLTDLPSALSGATRRDPSTGETVAFILAVQGTAVTSGGETYEWDIICADDAALTVNVTVLAKFPFTNAQAATLLVAGSIINLPVPFGSITRRFLGLQSVLTGGASSVTVKSWLAPQSMAQANRNYGTLIQVL